MLGGGVLATASLAEARGSGALGPRRGQRKQSGLMRGKFRAMITGLAGYLQGTKGCIGMYKVTEGCAGYIGVYGLITLLQFYIGLRSPIQGYMGLYGLTCWLLVNG